MAKQLEKCEDFGCVFSLVKKSVEKTLQRKRAGLMLALQHLPDQIGGYYGVGSNFIVLNKSLLQKVQAVHGEEVTKSYVFYVLLHEYLHSLGYLNEAHVRQLSHGICRRVFGEDHLASKIARYGIGSVIPEIGAVAGEEPSQRIEVVQHFETESITYIG